MNPPAALLHAFAIAVVNAAAIAAAATCLTWPCAVRANNAMMQRYGKQQLAQKQNRYGSWSAGGGGGGGFGNRFVAAGGWAAPSYGNLMRHYPVSTVGGGGGGGRYQAAGGGRQDGQVFGDDYYDGGPYDARFYDRSAAAAAADYAVVRYPSYGPPAGYYGPALADMAADDGGGGDAGDLLLYDDGAYDPVQSYYRHRQPTALGNRYAPPPPPPMSPPMSLHHRYNNGDQPPAATSRYPTDKIHKFRKVFMSNPVSPSNAFKSTKEQQLYDFWESLINGRLDDGGADDDDGAVDDGLRGWRQPSSPLDPAVSQLYQHLPPIFQQLQQKQKQMQLQQSAEADQRPSSSLSSSPLSSSSLSSSSSSVPFSTSFSSFSPSSFSSSSPSSSSSSS